MGQNNLVNTVQPHIPCPIRVKKIPLHLQICGCVVSQHEKGNLTKLVLLDLNKAFDIANNL